MKKKLKKIPLPIKIPVFVFVSILCLITSIVSFEASSSKFYNGYGDEPAWGTDGGSGSTVDSGSWNSNTDSCYYLQVEEGWGKPASWKIMKNNDGEWVKIKWSAWDDWYYPMNTWVEIDSEWYFVDDDGYIVKKWAFIPTSAADLNAKECGWFYFGSSSGKMQVGWQHIDGDWYYFNCADVLDSDYVWGECLYNTNALPDLNSSKNNSLSKEGKTARYVTGFNFTITTYLENDSGGYTVETSTTQNVSLGSNSYCETTISAPVKTGYTLNTSKSSAHTVTNSLYLAEDDDLAATLKKKNITWYYTRNTYTLTLYGNSGTVPTSSVSLKYAGTDNYSMTGNIPTRTGYTFTGWYTAPTGGKQIYNASGIVVNDGTYWSGNRNIYAGNYALYAQWTPKSYTVTYNPNGGTLTNGSATASVYCNANVNLGATATKDGRLFAGWGLSPADKRPLSSYVMPASDVTLYALYSLPVSDMKEAVLVSWNKTNAAAGYNSFPFTLNGTTNGDYHYSLSGINLTTGLSYSSIDDITWSILLYDNAGNYTVYGEPDPPVPDLFLQTVMHYTWNMEAEDWIYYATTSELAYENQTYTPAYLETVPDGYYAHSIDAPYRVTEAATTYAYYKPLEYTLYFDPNGGTCNTVSKTVYKDYFYGELPTAERKGHTFLGWYTEPEDGDRIVSSDRYIQNGDSTVYAHWNISEYDVIYDYATNGGNGADLTTAKVSYGSDIDLSVNAYKDGWEFVGWNTNPDATEGLTSYTMSDERVVLFAIYRKTITGTFIDADDTSTITQAVSETIYNRENEAAITVPKQHTMTNWTSLGWSIDIKADADVTVSSESVVSLAESQTFYGCYVKEVTLSYDTNGSDEHIPSQTLERFYNASGEYRNPDFTIAKAPYLSLHSFVEWMELNADGSLKESYPADGMAKFETDTLLTAKWDRYPEIEAYDRYFTLEEAQNGKITADRLFEKVTTTDKEDGTLINGSDVIVKNYHASDFTGVTTDEEVSITYQATDSFGNVTEKTITVHVVDTTVRQILSSYVRFINSQFFTNSDGSFVTSDSGGLEETSIWRTDENYQSLLEHALNKTEPEQSFSFTK